MLDIFLRMLQYVLPPHPSTVLLAPISPETFCTHYQERSVRGSICLSSYQDPCIKAAITANKFYNDQHAALLLAALLTKYLKTLPSAPTVLIPIPLSARREKERGYNQVIRVVSYLPQEANYHHSPLLKRTTHTKPQTTLHRTERLKNMEHVFSLDTTQPLPEHTRYIIIDDVLTTGATMQSAKAALLPHLPTGSTLICLCLAH